MKTILFIALCGFVLLPSAFGGSVDFETGAPCDFIAATALTNTYAGLGVTFSGPGGSDGGAILDQCGNFDGINAHSGVDFLAFNIGSQLSDGGFVTAPETILFTTPESGVGLWVGGIGTTYTLQAFDGSGNLLGSASILPPSGEWSQLTINTASISSLVLSFDQSVAVADDLTWNADTVPEPSMMALLGLGMAALAGFARRRRTL
jgi:PEP-CTERM motif